MGFSFPGFLKELRPRSPFGGLQGPNEMNLGSPRRLRSPEAPQPRTVRCGPWQLPGSPVTSRGPWQPGPPDFRVKESRSPVTKRGVTHFVASTLVDLGRNFRSTSNFSGDSPLTFIRMEVVRPSLFQVGTFCSPERVNPSSVGLPCP